MKKTLKKWAWFITILPILIIVFLFVKNIFENIFLKASGKCGKGILLNKTIATRTTTHLSYAFYNNGEFYTGNSQVGDLTKAGDSICVVYLESFPSVNRALKYFDSGKIKCDCNK